MSEISELTVVASVPGTSTVPALTLRRWTERDVPALVAAHRDIAMRRWLTRHIDDAGQAAIAIREQREAWEAGARFTFAVVEHPDAAGTGDPGLLDPIASVSVRRLDKSFDVAEVGYWVAAQARGRSVAPRAVQAALDWATELWRREPLRRFELVHTVGNDASCRVAQKLGFAMEQELPPSVKWPEPGHLHVRPWIG
ncbi:MAG TPA: GNAT family N-acetyltransferase [Actinospica sp.]|jgi:RimJ/RimL family protein N-acetyltransferase|nr:GNAT family N-acetyltransferase [Actinospica sp.]